MKSNWNAETILNWNVSKEDFDLIVAIARRAKAICTEQHIKFDQRQIIMDLNAVHANGNPLRLAQLLTADDGNFAHDVFGIARHLNRETGKLEHCFVPRYAAVSNKETK